MKSGRNLVKKRMYLDLNYSRDARNLTTKFDIGWGGLDPTTSTSRSFGFYSIEIDVFLPIILLVIVSCFSLIALFPLALFRGV